MRFKLTSANSRVEGYKICQNLYPRDLDSKAQQSMQSRSKSQYGLIWALSDRFQPQINRIEIRTHICRLSPIVVIQCGILRSNAGIACQRYFQKRDEMNGNSCSEQNRCNLTRNELILPAIQDVECHTVVIILTTQSASSTMWSSLCRSKSSE